MVELTKKDTPFVWTEATQSAFERLKEVLVSPDVMAFPSESGQYILDTDASDKTIGAVLSQVQKGTERVIAFGSHMLNRAERNYCVTDRELLVVKFFVVQYKHYLLGRRFLIRTNHTSPVLALQPEGAKKSGCKVDRATVCLRLRDRVPTGKET